MKKLLIFLMVLLMTSTAYATDRIGVMAEEADGSPAAHIYKLKFPNGTLSIANGVGTYTAAGTSDISKDSTIMALFSAPAYSCT